MLKDIKGFEGLYFIDEEGRVFNAKGKERKLTPNEKGYLVVSLQKEGKLHIRRVHRLVAEAFIPNPENKPQVNHKDGNKQNNKLSNLEWMNNSENQAHAYRTGLKGAHPVDMLDLDGNYIRTFYCVAEAERFVGAKCPNGAGITQCIQKGEHRTAYGFRWRDAQRREA